MALQLTRGSMLCRITRQFYCNSNIKTKCMSTNTPKVDVKPDAPDVHSIGTFMHTVSDFDRWLLVWVKRYPSKAEVPKQVTQDCMLQARSRARVRTCNILIFITLIGFLGAIISGKRDVAAGKSLHSIRMEWYEGLKREHEKEVAMAAAETEKK